MMGSHHHDQSIDYESNDASRVYTDANDKDDQNVFTERKDGPNFRSLPWPRAAILIVKSQIGLGVLAIPQVFHTLGFFTGILLLLAIFLMVLYGSFVVGEFKLKRPHVYSVADIGYLLSGPVIGEILGLAYALFLLFISGSGILSLSIGFNAITEHATCTQVFAIISCIIITCISLIKTLTRVSLLGYMGVISLVAGVMVTIVGVAVVDRPVAAPQTGPLDLQLRAFNNPTFPNAMVAVGNIIFSFSGTMSYVPIISEMKRPSEYIKSLLLAQCFVFGFNLFVGIIVYYYCGQYVASPALSSAGPLLKKISYGLSIPSLCVSAMLNVHFLSKYLFVRFLRKTRHLQEPTMIHWCTWIGIVVLCGVISYAIASSIPFYFVLVGLVGASFGSLFTLVVPGFMWLYEQKRGGLSLFTCSVKSSVTEKIVDTKLPLHIKPESQEAPISSSTRRYESLMIAFNIIIIIIGIFCAVAGLYASALSIRDAYKTGNISQPFSCADNSSS